MSLLGFMASTSNIEHVLIEAHKTMDCAGKAEDSIYFQFNPSELKIDFGVEPVDNEHATGESAQAQGSGYKYSLPKLEFNTVVDATGVMPPPKDFKDGFSAKNPTVAKYVEKLKGIVYDFVAELHGPYHLAVTWGEVPLPGHTMKDKKSKIFKGRMESFSVNYTLFGTKGNPVRAEIGLVIAGIEDPSKRATGNSPDLTHFIEVKPGDNLPKLCNEIYSDPGYFTQIARINNLPSIYAIEPGMRLLFPPLEKSSR